MEWAGRGDGAGAEAPNLAAVVLAALKRRPDTKEVEGSTYPLKRAALIRSRMETATPAVRGNALLYPLLEGAVNSVDQSGGAKFGKDNCVRSHVRVVLGSLRDHEQRTIRTLLTDEIGHLLNHVVGKRVTQHSHVIPAATDRGASLGIVARNEDVVALHSQDFGAVEGQFPLQAEEEDGFSAIRCILPPVGLAVRRTRWAA